MNLQGSIVELILQLALGNSIGGRDQFYVNYRLVKTLNHNFVFYPNFLVLIPVVELTALTPRNFNLGSLAVSWLGVTRVLPLNVAISTYNSNAQK